MSALDLDELKACIGSSETRQDVVDAHRLEQFRATLGPFLVSEAVEYVPPGFHWTLFQPQTPLNELRHDGHPARLSLLPELPFETRMWAGGEVCFHTSLKVGSALERISSVQSVDLKEGSTGALLFVVIAHDYISGGSQVISETQTIVYRDPSRSRIQKAESIAPAEGPVFKADSRLLFRYSALTFNAHRIHYDRDYAMNEEGYPGLVVHGPLQASLLMNHLATSLGTTRYHFSYRGTSPLFDGDLASLRIDREAQTTWIERSATDPTMKAKYTLMTA